MKRRWWLAGTLIASLGLAYFVSWFVTDRQRNEAQTALLAAIADVQAAHHAAIAAAPEASASRTPIDVFDMKHLLDPLGSDLQEDSTWNALSANIGLSRPWSEADLAAARTWTDSNAELVERAREIADRRLAINNQDPLQTTKVLRPDTFVAAGRVVLLAAIVEIADGDVNAAFADVQRAMEIAELAGTPHWAIWQMVRVGLYRNALEFLPPLVPSLSSYQRAALQAQLARAHGRNACAASLAGELRIYVENFDSLLITPAGRIGRPWMNANLTRFMRGMLPLVEAIRANGTAGEPLVPTHMAIAPPPPSRLPLVFQMSDNTCASFYHSFARILEDQAIHDATIDVARTALAICEFRIQTGEVPTVLNALTNNLDGSVPLDPFTQKPLIYQPIGEYFVLRSTGPNEIDDTASLGRAEDDIAWEGD